MKPIIWLALKICLTVLAVITLAAKEKPELQYRPGTQGKIAYALPAFDQDPNEAHTSAAFFAERVSKLLKDKYPSRVENLKVQFMFGQNKRGQLGFSIIWSCTITPTGHKQDADYYFDRRGMVRIDRNQAVAETDLMAREMMGLFRQNYHNYYDLGMLSASTTDSKGRTWYLEEHFIGAKKY